MTGHSSAGSAADRDVDQNTADQDTADQDTADLDTDDQAVRVWRRLRNLVQNNDRRRLVATALGMSFIRAKALRRLAAGPLSMRQLADELVTDRPYTSVFVDDLERRGLVRREVDPSDRRGKIVSLTADGARVAAQAESILDQPPAGFGRLSADDLAALERILRCLE
jgi:DNA-binding MarR family transcriptional regulator